MNRLTENILSIPIILTLLPMIFIETHWSMTKNDEHVTKLKKASFKEFKEAIANYEWEEDSPFRDSLFSIRKNSHLYDYIPRNEAYIHADIFRFKDVGYLMTPLGYFLAKLHIKKIAKRINKRYYKPYIN